MSYQPQVDINDLAQIEAVVDNSEEAQRRAKIQHLQCESIWTWSGLLARWTGPLEKLGVKYNLKVEDMPAIDPTLVTAKTTKRFFQVYEQSVKKEQHQKTVQGQELYQNDPQKLKKFNQTIPWEIKSSSGLELLPEVQTPDVPKLTSLDRIDRQNDLDDFKQLESIFQQHPAIDRLEQLDPIELYEYVQKQDKIKAEKKAQDEKDAVEGKLVTSSSSTSSSSSSSSSQSPQPESNVPMQTLDINSYPYKSTTKLNLNMSIPFIFGLLWASFTSLFITLVVSEGLTYVGQLLQPQLIKFLFGYFKDYKQDPNSVTTVQGILYATPIIMISVFQAFSTILRSNLLLHSGNTAAGSLMTSIFSKLLRIAPYSIANDEEINIGSITNLMSQDAQMVFHSTFRMLSLVSSPIAVVAVVIMMVMDFGRAALVTMGLLLFPYPVIIAMIRDRFDKRYYAARDARVKTNLNMLYSIRVAKLYNWEPSFQAQLEVEREIELSALSKAAFLTHISDMTSHLYPLIVSFATLATFVSINDTFSPEDVVLLLAYLNALSTPLIAMGESIAAFARFRLSMSRIAHFLSQEELPVLQSQLKTELEGFQQYQSEFIHGKTQPNSPSLPPLPSPNFQTPSPSQDLDPFALPPLQSPQTSLPSAPSIIADLSPRTMNSIRHLNQKRYIINIKNCDFYWSSFQTPAQLPILTNISLQVKSGEILGVVSPSGVGKTALLCGIIGQLYPQPHKSHQPLTAINNLPIPPLTAIDPSDSNYYRPNPLEINGNGPVCEIDQNHPRARIEHVNSYFSFTNHIEVIPSHLIDINGRIAYCAQQPWVLNSTVRDNIIVNQPFDSEKFKRVVEASALGQDLSIFADGDLTIVAEGGLTLSGGQQARLQFARALYHADVVDCVILDDIFAAVDSIVAKTMFYKGVKGILKDKAIVLALNSHYDYLQECNEIICLAPTISQPDQVISCTPPPSANNNNNNNDQEANASDTYSQFSPDQKLTPQQLSIQQTLNDVYWIRLFQYLSIQQQRTLDNMEYNYHKALVEKEEAFEKTKFAKVTWPFRQLIKLIGPKKNNSNIQDSSDEDRDQVVGDDLDDLGYSPADADKKKKQYKYKKQRPLHLAHLDYLDEEDNVQSSHLSPITQAEIDGVNLELGYRPPSTILFRGQFDDLLRLNLPLLDGIVFSLHNEVIVEDHVDNDAKFGQLNLDKNRQQQEKLLSKVEMTVADAQQTSATSTSSNNDDANKAMVNIDDESESPIIGEANNSQQNPQNNTSQSGGDPSQTTIHWSTYQYYFQGTRTVRGLWIVAGILFTVSVAAQFCRSFSDIWLVYWSEDEQLFDARKHERKWWLMTTAMMFLVTMLCFIFQSLAALYIWIDGSRLVFRNAIYRIFHSTTAYLDTTSIGSIINKVCGKDLDTVDFMLADFLLFLLQQTLLCCGAFFIAFYASPLYILPIIPLAILIYIRRPLFHNTAVQIQRIKSATLSPMYSMFGSICNGTASIRAYTLQPIFTSKYHHHVTQFLRASQVAIALDIHFSVYLAILTCIFVVFMCYGIVLLRNHINTELGMLALSYSFRLVGLLQFVVKFYSQATQNLTSVQRIQILNEIPQEPLMVTPEDTRDLIKSKQPKEFQVYQSTQYNTKRPLVEQSYQERHANELHHWPWYGGISFKNVTVRYRPELPIVLNNLSFDIEPGMNIGLCGRTGSGKSTLLQLLPLLIPLEKGSITIDGIDITKIGRGDLRSRLAIIPQSPILIEGTIRSNLDPFNRYTDDELWNVLEWVDLVNKVKEMPNALNSLIEAGGSNLSASEKQLLCIGRALVTQYQGNIGSNNSSNDQPKTNSNPSMKQYLSSLPTRTSVLIGDEITALIPNDTGIQSTIRKVFKKATIINIAHRLSTIIHCDKVVVLHSLTEDDIKANRTSLLEYEIPFVLLNNPKSRFYQMCLASGQEQFLELYKAAKESYFTRILPNLKAKNTNNCSLPDLTLDEYQDSPHIKALLSPSNALLSVDELMLKAGWVDNGQDTDFIHSSTDLASPNPFPTQ